MSSAPSTGERDTYQVAVDTGGTFTDIAVVGPDGRVLVWKVPSQPEAPDDALLQGVGEALDQLKTDLSTVTRFVHGTTVATNALLTRSGARVGLVTTEGFRDVLAIGHQTRPRIYDFEARRPAPLVDRDCTFQVHERVSAGGSVEAALDEEEVSRVGEQIRAQNCDVVVVSFLNAYANNENEVACARLLAKQGAAEHVFAATSVSAEMREYERTSTAVLNGYVQPVISSYVGRLESRLEADKLATRLWIMQSNGGLLSCRAAREESVRTILSGLAGGVMGAAQWAGTLDLARVVSFDIGGTSTDIALIRDGRPDVMTSGEVEGYGIRMPAVDVHTIGAGGGSLAWRDAGGGLRVGPQSAGADPGPVCYGRGGEQLTVTDAHLLLGRLGTTLLDGRLDLDVTRARQRLDSFAGELGLGEDEAAAGILRVITATMARGIRAVSVERGVDVRDCVLLAFGGAGPLHAGELVRELGMKAAVIPPHPGIASAVGMLDAPVRHDFAANLADRNADPADLARARTVIDDLTQQARDFAEVEGIAPEDVSLECSLDVRYVGQSYELPVPFEPEISTLRESLDSAHRERYGYADPQADMELVTGRVALSLPFEAVRIAPMTAAGDDVQPSDTRSAYFDGDWVDTPVYRRDAIPADLELSGPLIIEQLDSTAVVLPGQRCAHDRFGCLHLTEQDRA